MKKQIIHSVLFLLLFAGCGSGAPVDITPHTVNPEADVYYRQALKMLDFYDVDSTRKAVNFLNRALLIDSLNPDYHGMKAKLYAEMGLLDSALILQRVAEKMGAINGEYLFQLGLLQAAKDLPEEAHLSFERSNKYLEAVLKQYPDSLGAFIIQQAAYALFLGEDSVFMNDVPAIRERFSTRLMEVEMTRRTKPSSLIRQLKQIEDDSFGDIAAEVDKLLE